MQRQASPLRQWAQSSPSLLALETEKRDYTWAELETLINARAEGLVEQGVTAGEVVTCVGKNSVESVLLFLACIELGAICAFTMPQEATELEVKLNTLYSSKQARRVWFSHDNHSLCSIQLNEGRALKRNKRVRQYAPDSIATIVFTSGSTGTPKAVAHTSRQHLASASGLLQRFRFSLGDKWLLSLPLYHVSGLAIVYRWLHSGATLKIGCGDLHKDIQGVTHASLVATQLQRLLDSNTALTLTRVLLGGSHISPSLIRQATERDIDAWLGYGLTEAASTVTAKSIDDHYSAGFVLPKRDVKLQGSRILIGGETLASGYYNQGKLTPIARNGWFDSKDLGEWQGRELTIIGRADNQFISGGENIHCEEIESVLNQLESVRQAFVIPIEDSEFGHRPVAVLDCHTMPTTSQIEPLLKSQLSRFKWPIAYHKMPNELLTSGIKVSRIQIKQWLTGQLS